MPYRVILSPAAARDVRKLDRQYQEQIATVLRELQVDPRCHGVIKLTNAKGLYRIRSGNYRIIFGISDASEGVVIMAVSDRKDAY